MIETGTWVEVYWNLHKLCWSVRRQGKVIAHADYVSLRDCKLVVQPAGRQKVLAEKCKNVHAFVRGFWVDPDERFAESSEDVSAVGLPPNWLRKPFVLLPKKSFFADVRFFCLLVVNLSLEGCQKVRE